MGYMTHYVVLTLLLLYTALWCSQLQLFGLLIIAGIYIYKEKQGGQSKINPSGKTVLITGCDTGIGHNSALRLAELGVHVYAGCLDAEGQGARSLASHNIHVMQLDVTKQSDIDQCLERVRQECGEEGLWGLVNNAGIAVQGDFELSTFNQMHKVIEVNLMGVIRMCKTFLPCLRKAKGRIVNITSLKGLLALPMNSAYCASKFGVEGLSDVLRMELKRFDIKVIVVEPSNFGGATQIINEAKMREDAEEMLANMNEETKSVYGEDYLEKILKILKDSQPTACFNLNYVSSDVIKALFLEHPYPRYLTGGGDEFVDTLKIKALLAPLLPETIVDFHLIQDLPPL